MVERLKLIKLILSPFLIFSLTIYLCLHLFSPIKLAYQISLVVGSFATLIFTFLEKPNYVAHLKFLFNWKNLLLLIPAVFIIFAFGIVLSPLVKTVVIDGHQVFGLTSLGDYYKHLYILTSIKTEGLPPHHPFFPSSGLSYYYGYYLLPSAISSTFNLDLATVFFFYLLFTTFTVIVVATQISLSLFRSWYQHLLAVFLFLIGTGLDIVPTLKMAKSGLMTANHIEFWSQILSLNNYLVNNLYTVLLWVPQHSLPSIIVLVAGLYFVKEKEISIFWLTLVIWFCFISSTFVSTTLLVWLGLAFLFQSRNRLKIVVSCLIAFCLLMPYLRDLTGRGSLLSYGFYMTPFQYFPGLPFWLNCFLTFFTEYGLIIIAIPIYFITRNRKDKKEAWLVSLAVFTPILIGLFVRSAGFNDFSMRSILPVQMALPFMMAYSLEKVQSYAWKKVVFLFLVLSFIPTMTGFFYEIHFRLIDRSTIDIATSDLLTRLRKNPVANLAVIDNEDWVFLIPSYGYQAVYSPRLFDSTGYISNSGLKEQSEYENKVNSLFIYPTVGKSADEVAKVRQNNFNMINDFFVTYKHLNFVIPVYHGGEVSLNPWFNLFESLGVEKQPLTNQYSLFKGAEIDEALSKKHILLDQSKLERLYPDKEDQVYINKGVWLVMACSRPGMDSLKLQFLNHSLLVDQKVTTREPLCAGQLHNQLKNEVLKITESSQFESIHLAPVLASPLLSK